MNQITSIYSLLKLLFIEIPFLCELLKEFTHCVGYPIDDGEIQKYYSHIQNTLNCQPIFGSVWYMGKVTFDIQYIFWNNIVARLYSNLILVCFSNFVSFTFTANEKGKQDTFFFCKFNYMYNCSIRTKVFVCLAISEICLRENSIGVAI